MYGRYTIGLAKVLELQTKDLQNLIGICIVTCDYDLKKLLNQLLRWNVSYFPSYIVHVQQKSIFCQNITIFWTCYLQEMGVSSFDI